MSMIRITAFVAAIFPVGSYAAGTEDTAPKPSETTQVCTEGLVWDLATKSCMTPDQSTNDDNARLDDTRELAYEGRFAEALTLLRSLQAQDSDLALTYYGFVHRNLGEEALGMTYYHRALAQNPDNLLARSYMGQAYVAAGAIEMAGLQLVEIRMRGGRGTWAERSLDSAIATGVTYRF